MCIRDSTYTLNWDYGSGVVVKGAGFLLNDEMDDFSAKPGVANAFGVVFVLPMPLPRASACCLP